MGEATRIRPCSGRVIIIHQGRLEEPEFQCVVEKFGPEKAIYSFEPLPVLGPETASTPFARHKVCSALGVGRIPIALGAGAHCRLRDW